jgi:UDP-GlcNAc:undecaprenyl-phosphate GlcNAc-1-phosphate transferase
LLLLLIYIATFFVSGILISLVTNSLLLSFSQTLGIRNKNDVVIRWSNQSKPSLGGVSFFMVFIFTALGYAIFSDGENIFRNFEFAGFICAASLAFLMGLADDAYNTRPFLKLFAQILCGVSLVVTGTVADMTHIFWLDAFLTVLWVVVVMNSLNMLDNMDGITGTTVLFIVCGALAANWLVNGFSVDIWSIMLIAMIGGLLGFLRYNINPSKIFMGDAGSQFIGLFVAFFAVKHFWNLGHLTQNHSWVGIITCLTAFTPAAADTLSVVINRIKRGQSPMVGGKDHTTHHMVYSGKTDKQVWMVFALIGFISMILSISVIYFVINGYVYLSILFVPYFWIVFFYLYRNTIKYKQPVDQED